MVSHNFFIDPTWRAANDYNCKELDTEIFFSQDSQGVKAAIAICNTCPVQTWCLAYALENDERYGVWGGVSERGRARIRSSSRVKI